MDGTDISVSHAHPTTKTLDPFNRLATRSYASRSLYVDPNLTFSPKLNAVSIRLARRRSERMEDVKSQQEEQSKLNQPASQSYSFRPVMSLKSLKIAEKLSSTFLDRQQQHLERKQVFLEQTHKLPFHTRPSKTKGSPTKSNNITALTFPQSPSRPQPTGPPPSQMHLPRCPSATAVTGGGERGGVSLAVTSVSPSVRSSSTLSHYKPEGGREGPRAGDVNRCLFRSESMRKGEGERRKDSQRTRHNTSLGVAVGEGVRPKPTPNHQRTCSVPTGVSLRKPSTDIRSYSKLKHIHIRADELIKERKVFVVRGNYKAIRRGLRERGWVEKDYCGAEDMAARGRGAGKGEGVADDDDDDGNVSPNEESSDEEHSDEEDYCLLGDVPVSALPHCIQSRAVRSSVPYFIWTLRREPDLFTCLRKDQYVNHVKGAGSFTTKVGLCTHLREAVWLGDVDVSTFFPRCYQLSSEEDKECFVEDYRRTAALSILKAMTEGGGVLTATPPSEGRPEVPEEAVSLALRAAQFFLNTLEHDDIESSSTWLVKPLGVPEWGSLLNHYYTMAFHGGKVQCGVEVEEQCADLLDQLRPLLPQLLMDGVHNIWIVKPGALSRGRGIECMARLESIQDLVSSPTQKKEGKWIVQKYIERPLLIHRTKFDIRQWFLVADCNPLTMWMYKSSYLRFSSQPFSLEDMDGSIHLCNNSIQKNYTISSGRSPLLPEENMWTHNQFIAHLNMEGRNGPCLWDSVIYPGMTAAVIHVLQSTQDVIEPQVAHSFELYGADFMITTDFRPWLIEVNSCPTMARNTSVTRRLCKAVQEDTLKVIVDRRSDRNCDIGDFEFVYKQPKFDVPLYHGAPLTVEGSAILKPKQHGGGKGTKARVITLGPDTSRERQ